MFSEEDFFSFNWGLLTLSWNEPIKLGGISNDKKSMLCLKMFSPGCLVYYFDKYLY